MNEINKKFDGLLWEWKGRRDIRELKPICPKCQYELDIKITGPQMTTDGPHITFSQAPLSYSCPKCSFYTNTTIEDVDSLKDLHKVARKEFEHRQRLMVRKTSKKNK